MLSCYQTRCESFSHAISHTNILLTRCKLREQARLQKVWESPAFHFVTLALIVSNFVFTIKGMENKNPNLVDFYERIDTIYTVLFAAGAGPYHPTRTDATIRFIWSQILRNAHRRVVRARALARGHTHTHTHSRAIASSRVLARTHTGRYPRGFTSRSTLWGVFIFPHMLLRCSKLPPTASLVADCPHVSVVTRM